MIITFLGETVKEYLSNYPLFLSKIIPVCPICEGSCHSHCWYKRKIRAPELATIMIQRVKCANVKCGATHAILPDFIYPKGRYSEQIREAAINGCENENKTQEAVSQVQSVKTTGRWIAKYRKIINQVIAALQSILARLRIYDIPCAGSFSEQIQELQSQIEQVLNPLQSSCCLGKTNILLTWQNMGLWI
jgi:hypothetical protein